MNVQEVRLAVMNSLIRTRFNETARQFALAVGRQERQINDMQRGRKPFGEKVARSFEEKLALPPYYFDQVKNIDPERIQDFAAAANRGQDYEVDKIAIVTAIWNTIDDEGRTEIYGMAQYQKHRFDQKQMALPKHNGNQ